MVGTTRHAPIFSKLVDRLAPISADTAASLKNFGVEAVGRYVENLTISERDGIFAAGLGILPLSKAPSGPLNGTFGHSHADTLLQHATLLDVPPGVHFMVDFEAQQGSHADVRAYDTALTDELARPGYVPLAYVGAGQLLSGVELFALPNVHLYWRGGSLVVPEPNCGFAIWQIPPLEQPVAGAVVDMSMTGADLRGRTPILWYP